MRSAGTAGREARHAGLKPFCYRPFIIYRLPKLDRSCLYFIIRCDHHDSCCAIARQGNGTLWYADSILINSLLKLHTSEHPWQKDMVRVRELSTQGDHSGGRIDGDIGE